MSKFKEKMQRFLAGRNGYDAICRALFVGFLLVWGIDLFVDWIGLMVIEYVILFYTLFRIFSRNVAGRRRENDAFLFRWNKVKRFFRDRFAKIAGWFRHSSIPKVRQAKAKRPDPAPKTATDKDHTIVDCPVCRHSLRVRKIKGEHYVMCPACHHEVKVRT